MLPRVLTIAVSTAAAAAAFTFFPARPAQAYPEICGTTYWTCMYSATSIAGLQQCVVAFEACSGGANPPPPPPRVSATAPRAPTH